MQLTINGKDRDVQSPANLLELLEKLEISSPHFAVALNYQVVSKSQYQTTSVHEGDKIEIVHAVGGGI